MTDSLHQTFRILTLDGGGAKGFYSLGVLREVEALLGAPLCESFDLIYGTSTGSIIAALLALGRSVDEVHCQYKKHVPKIMRASSPKKKSERLSAAAKSVFGNASFTAVKTGIGIVATQWLLEKPMIFKGSLVQAHGREATFVPGFGCKIADAVKASCSAFPFFQPTTVSDSKGVSIELIDGGYCANNPTLYAIADALTAFRRSPDELRVLSVGVGMYPVPKRRLSPRLSAAKLILGASTVELLPKTLNVNTTSMEQLREILFENIKTVRVNDRFEQPEMATDLMESDLRKLNVLFQRGGESFGNHEKRIKELLGVQVSRMAAPQN